MDRMTRKTELGNYVLKSCVDCKYKDDCGGYDVDCEYYLVRELGRLEDKLENGTLVELPCKVGDTLWYVNKHRPIPRIEANLVHTIDMFEDLITNKFVIRIWTQNGTFYADNMPNVFKTKAEAEAKLKELQDEQTN